jgi:hypothetical protein
MPPSRNSPNPCYLVLRRPAKASCFADASKKLRKQTSSMRKTVRTEVLTSYFLIFHRNMNAANTVTIESSSFVITALHHYFEMTHPQRNFRHVLNARYFGRTDLRTSFLKTKFCYRPAFATAGLKLR